MTECPPPLRLPPSLERGGVANAPAPSGSSYVSFTISCCMVLCVPLVFSRRSSVASPLVAHVSIAEIHLVMLWCHVTVWPMGRLVMQPARVHPASSLICSSKGHAAQPSMRGQSVQDVVGKMAKATKLLFLRPALPILYSAQQAGDEAALDLDAIRARVWANGPPPCAA